MSAELWDFLFLKKVAKHWSQVISAEKKNSLVSTGTVFIDCTQTDSAFQRVLIVGIYKYLHITFEVMAVLLFHLSLVNQPCNPIAYACKVLLGFDVVILRNNNCRIVTLIVVLCFRSETSLLLT